MVFLQNEILKEHKDLKIAGGIIPERDISELKEMGVSEIFGPGAESREIIDFILKRKNNTN
jgi:methylmalonyl-CoA mutase C-terminal domain/subunit